MSAKWKLPSDEEIAKMVRCSIREQKSDEEMVLSAFLRHAEPAIRALEAERDALEAKLLFPGTTVCGTCGFTLTSRTFDVARGEVCISDADHENICPNDGTPMRRLTWAEAYKRQSEVNDALADRERALATENAALAKKVEALEAAQSGALLERTAQIAAHRGCCGTEHDPPNGKLHGYCVVCGVPWPCAYAGTPPAREGEETR